LNFLALKFTKIGTRVTSDSEKVLVVLKLLVIWRKLTTLPYYSAVLYCCSRFLANQCSH